VKTAFKPQLLFLVLLLSLSLASCSGSGSSTAQVTLDQPASSTPKQAAATPLPEAEVTFAVSIPPGTSPDDSVTINILDEVSGLALNSLTYPMDVGKDGSYNTTLNFPVGSVIKYRYSRHTPNATLQEHTSDGRPVRYRLYYVQGPGVLEDVVSRWTDTNFKGQSGRITGQVLNAQTGQPVPGLLVTAGGAQSLTGSDGSYLLEGLPPGTHNLVAYALDGAYNTFQQGALVAADSTTPAELRLTPARYATVTFDVTTPAGTIPAVPIRIAGNLYQLGNTYADLSGGVSTLSTRMPALNLVSDGKYSLTLSLPVGADIQYTYTIGDGFWNTELTSTGEGHLRQLIVPGSDTTIQDSIESWRTENATPVTLDVTVPAGTPSTDYVSIQFNPLFGWTEPIPMWRIGENRWAYVLNGPTQIIDKISYRFCRNNQCDSADDASTMGPMSPGYPVEPAMLNATTKKQVSAWAWFSPDAAQALPEQYPVTPYGNGFISGIEYQPYYHPSWTPLNQQILNDVQKTGANWVVLTPTWTYTRLNPPVIEPVAGSDPLWLDSTETISQTLHRGLNVAIFPTPQFPGDTNQWWAAAERDFPWWVSWFERYRNFLLNHADLAAQEGAQSLIIGGDWIFPALPGGTLADGTPSGVPADAETRWRSLIDEIRSRYNGKLFWALSSSQAQGSPPPFLDAVDGLDVQFSPSLTSSTEPTTDEMYFEAARLLDEGLLPLQTQTGLPVILAAAYPSADGAATACLKLPSQENCLDWQALSRPNPDIGEIAIDLQEQADIYSALLRAVNERPWITGFVSTGYYPPAILQDKSLSIHGKPAENVLSYWYPQLLAPVQ
jgi:hypothetical protein